MATRTLQLTDTLYEYLLEVSRPEPALLAELRQETQTLPSARMQIAPEQGQLLGLLVELIAAERVIEVGVFTGYSSLSMALRLPAAGQLLACDVSEEFTAIAQRYWQRAGVLDRIELVLAPAHQTLAGRIKAGASGQFDLAFIDADKSRYDTYYEQCLQLLRPGGLIAVDNMFWGGAVADLSDTSENTQFIRALNRKVAQDERVSPSLVPIGDGLLLARKR